MPSIDWYFDFVSPFSYLAFETLERHLPDADIQYRPVVLGGLLAHWENRGPAEIPPKRAFTYAHCIWLAERHGVAYRMPSAHPFNPIPLLRAALAAGPTRDVVGTLFRFVWRDGLLPQDDHAWRACLESLGVSEEDLTAPAVKAALREATDSAAARGIFGVPTLCVGADRGVQSFWGLDAMPMAADYLAGHPVFDSPEYARAAHLPYGLPRR